MNKYRLQSKYPTHYKELEIALDIYADDHELKGYRYQTDTGKYKYNAIASHVLDFCNETFSYEKVVLERYKHYLQGLGLSIPYYNTDILELAIKDDRLKEDASEKKNQTILDQYWSFMAMRLISIAKSKN